MVIKNIGFSVREAYLLIPFPHFLAKPQFLQLSIWLLPSLTGRAVENNEEFRVCVHKH